MAWVSFDPDDCRPLLPLFRALKVDIEQELDVRTPATRSGIATLLGRGRHRAQVGCFPQGKQAFVQLRYGGRGLGEAVPLPEDWRVSYDRHGVCTFVGRVADPRRAPDAQLLETAKVGVEALRRAWQPPPGPWRARRVTGGTGSS